MSLRVLGPAAGGAPGGPAGGSLTGTYPNPGLTPAVVKMVSLEPGNLGAAYTVDFASVPNSLVVVKGTLNANCTVTLSNRAAGCEALLLLSQDGTGGRSLTVSDGSTSTAVTIPATANATTVVEAICPDATDIYAAPIGVPGPTGPTGNTGATGGTGPAGSGSSGWGGWVRPFGLDAMAITAPIAVTANTICGTRIVIPKTGTLHDLAVYIGSVTSGNVRVGVYDTGDASAAVRTLLTSDTLTVATPTASGWRIIGDPNLAVTAGQMLDLAVLPDNNTITLGRAALNNAAMGLLPAGFIPATGALAKLNWTKVAAVGNTLDATIAEASCASATTIVPVIARVV